MNDYRFGNFICRLRTEKGITQEDLGRILGVSDKAVSKWENGAAKPRIEVIKKLADTFGVTVDELLRGERNPEQPDPEKGSAPGEPGRNATGRKRPPVIAWVLAGVAGIAVLVGLGILLSLPFRKTPPAATGEPSSTEAPSCAHDYRETVISPTCETDGYTEYRCAVCGHSYRGDARAALGHAWQEIGHSDRGCVMGEVTEYACDRCKKERYEPNGNPGSHDFRLEKTVPPSRTSEGYDLYTCTYCHQSEQRNKTSRVNFSTGLRYEETPSGCYVTDMGTCTDEDLVIPAVNEYGKKVLGIRRNGWNSSARTRVTSVTVQEGIVRIESLTAFSNAVRITLPKSAPQKTFDDLLPVGDRLTELTVALTDFATAYPDGFPQLTTVHLIGDDPMDASLYRLRSITTVTVPDSWSTIPHLFCAELTKLTSFTFPSRLVTVGEDAFSGTGLTAAVLPDAVRTIGSNAFYCCPLKEFRFPTSLTDIGSRAFFGTELAGELILPTGLKTIKGHAFAGTKITGVRIPDSVTSAGYAFCYCPLLESATVGRGITDTAGLFLGCEALKSVTLPDSLATVGSETFADCTGLTDIRLPGQLRTVKGGAFRNCTRLRTVSFPEGLTMLGDECFSGCASLETVTLPAKVTNIGKSAFRNCQALSSVTFLCTLQTIPDNCFGGCEKLSAVNYADASAVKEIGESAFYACGALSEFPFTQVQIIGDWSFWGTGLRELTIPEGVRELSGAFSHCSRLTSVKLPESIREIGACFTGCESLTELTLPRGLTGFHENNFSGCKSLTKLTVYTEKALILNNGAPHDLPAILQLIIADGASVPVLPAEMLTGLVSVELPDSVTVIPDRAFCGAEALQSVTLPAHLKRIGSFAFYRSGLERVTVPATVTTIGEKAFAKCSALRAVDFSGAAVRLEGETFADCPLLRSLGNVGGIIHLTKTDFAGTDALTETDGMIVLGRFLLDTNPDTLAVDLMIPETVSVISDGAVKGNSYLRSVKFHAGVTYIGDSAFSGCVGLKTVDWNGCRPKTIGNSAFSGCRFTEFTLPEGVTEWGTNICSGCTGLVSVTVPDSVEWLADGFFSGCQNLTTATFGRGLKRIGANVFDVGFRRGYPADRFCVLTTVNYSGTQSEFDNITWDESNGFRARCATVAASDGTLWAILRSVSTYDNRSRSTLTADGTLYLEGTDVAPDINLFLGSFYGDVKRIVFGEGITGVDINFENCKNVKEVIFSSTVSVFNAYQLVGTPWYEALELSDGLYLHGNRLLFGSLHCTGTVTVPEGVTEIAYRAFYRCGGVTGMNFPSTLRTVAEDAFSGCAMESLEIPDGVTVNGRLFTGPERSPVHVRLTLTDPEHTKIAVYTKELRTVVFREGTLTIPEYCVWSCTGTVLVVVPKSVTKIQEFAVNDGAILCLTADETAALVPTFSSMKTALYREEKPKEEPGRFWHWDADGNPVLWD